MRFGRAGANGREGRFRYKKLTSTLLLLASGSWRQLTALSISKYVLLAFQFFALLIALKINRKIEWLAPSLWILFPISLSVILVRARYDDTATPAVTLLRLIGLFSSIYSLIRYPLMPPMDGMNESYAVLLALWMLSIAAGVLCFRFPSL